MNLTLINPNTNSATTATMVAIAAEAAGVGATVTAITAGFGAPLIYDEEKLAIAANAVVALAPQIEARSMGVIVSAFGDPGLEHLREILSMPVTGIAEAAMLEAAADGRRFVVVTTTPGLADTISAAALRYGVGACFQGVELTPGEPAQLMADPGELLTALKKACDIAAGYEGVGALVIGGGPLASAARSLRTMVSLPLIEPIPAAVRLAIRRSQGADRP